MNALKLFFIRRLASDLSAAKFAQVACYIIALGVFVLSVFKLTTLQLTEAELFFGVLLVLALFSSMLCGGTLVRIEAELTKRNDTRSP